MNKYSVNIRVSKDEVLEQFGDKELMKYIIDRNGGNNDGDKLEILKDFHPMDIVDYIIKCKEFHSYLGEILEDQNILKLIENSIKSKNDFEYEEKNK